MRGRMRPARSPRRARPAPSPSNTPPRLNIEDAAMGLRFLEHLLILTHDPEGTRDWFVNSLGLRDGQPPEFGFPVYWLYIGGQDVIHIGKAHFSDHQDPYLETPNDVEGADY